MSFILPAYQAPDFALPIFAAAPDAKTGLCEKDGVAPEDYHATSIFPEYFKLNGKWRLAEESRMDSVVVFRESGALEVVEPRYLRRGDRVLLGRSESGEEGIYLHADGFGARQGPNAAAGGAKDRFAFRMGRSRETTYSRDYDQLYRLLRHEREHGSVIWVAGPAFSFDADARRAMQSLVEGGYVHGLLAGNALAAHDLEAGYLRTALGQDIYTQESQPGGHYNHLDTINQVRRSGSIRQFIQDKNIGDGIMASLVKNDIPFVLTGSIRDDGPLPETVADNYEGQLRMRALVRKATTVICLATQLHTIAAGNMTPSFRVANGSLRPLYLYSIDISEFVVNKLRDRGSLSAVSLVTNVQDFIVHVAKGLGVM